MEFADGVVRAAWKRQGGRCAKCGRWLVWARRGREYVTGAWQPHHKNPEDSESLDSMANCIIFCSGMADCHFKEGHAGIDWTHHAPLRDAALLFLHSGDEEAERTPKPPATEKGSLVGAFFGVRQSSERGRQAATKRTSKRGAQRRARANGSKEAANGLGLTPTGDRPSAGLTR
jgi:hypothetical protein